MLYSLVLLGTRKKTLMVISDSELKNLLISSDTLSEKTLQDLAVFAKSTQVPLYQAVIEKGVLTDQKLGKLVAFSLKLPFVELSKRIIPEEIFHTIPEKIAHKHKIVLFEENDKTISLATANPENKELIANLSKKTSKKPVIHFATENDIDTTLQMYQKSLQQACDELVREELGSTNILTNDAPIIKIVDLLLAYAYRDKASDVHIEAEEENTLVRFRIDSILQDVLTLDKSLHSSIVTRIKVLAHLRTDEHMDAQDGKMRMTIDDERVDIRVSVIPTTEGEKIVLRLLSSRFKSFSLTDLGMHDTDLQKLTEAINKSFGCVLATGPTGSGKTTSIYALLKMLNTRDKNIMTIEDPVEYRVKGVNHIPVNPRAGLTFANGLRSILRQDPNVIFVGEIRDSETADIAVNAALTGHLVLSTLHTNDAATALPRLIDMKVEPFLIASTVNVIVAQRLVRKICVVCKEEVLLERKFVRRDISQAMLDKYFGRKDPITVYKGKGCKICHNTGFLGRVGVFEVLEVSEKIRQLIVEKADASIVRKQAISEGMVSMLDDGLEKVATGTTTLEEILRVIKAETR